MAKISLYVKESFVNEYAESRVIFCPVESPIACENADPSAEPI